MTVLQTHARERLSDDFLAANRRERILRGVARAISEASYREAKIADIVREAHCARNTFYETFGSKADAALALVADVYPELGDSFTEIDLPAALLAVELAATRKTQGDDDAVDAVTLAREADRALRSLLEDPRVDGLDCSGPLSQTLPPGRHGLPTEFVAANQRARILNGLATAIVGRGFLLTRISDVTRLAQVSRRTFYEHFISISSASLALAASTSPTAVGVLTETEPGSGLDAAVVEAVAARVAGVGDPRTARVLDTLQVVITSAGSAAEDCEQVAA
jgi:AcrR family transcriptional regulator